MVTFRSVRSVIVALALGLCACEDHHGGGHLPPVDQSRQPPEVRFADAPPMSKGAFPCTDCHEPDLPLRPKRRPMEKAHTEIVLKHGGERMWCWDCHDLKDRDKLRTASGDLLEYDMSHELCGQCHGGELRDWRAGAHGRRDGNWDGPRTALRCVHCHEAHSPHFKPLKPATRPTRPERTR